MKQYWLTLTLIGLATGAIAAEVPGTTRDNPLNRQAVLTYTDGTRVAGTIAAVNSATASLALADGSVLAVATGTVGALGPVIAATLSSSTSANGGVEAFSAAANPRSTSQSTKVWAGAGASMALGIRDANMQYYAGFFYFLGGLGLGFIGVCLSYIIPYLPPPTPAVMPDPAHVDVSSFVAGYQKEAKKIDHRSAWAGFGTQAAIVTLLFIIVAHSISQSHGIVS